MEEDGQKPRSPNGTTWEGCSVLLDINDGDRLIFARLSPAATVKIGDKKLSLRPLVGCPFGSLFQVTTGPNGSYLERIPSAPSSSTITAASDDAGEKDFQSEKCDISKDNRSLVDNNSAQGLSSEDIDTMRREGATGHAIIEALIANSSTFVKKTVFSQEKYKLRKQKKYAPKVLLRRPSARSISEAYFKKYPMRIGYMRLDTLSLLLSMSNVHAYSDVLVVDKVGGIVTGAVAERLGGAGHICCTYFGEKPYPLDIVKIFNFNTDVCTRILQASFSSLSLVQGDGARDEQAKSVLKPQFLKDQVNADEAYLSNTNMPSDSGDFVESSEEPIVAEEVSRSHIDKPTYEANEATIDGIRARKSVVPGRQADPESINMWKERGFTSLIFAAPELDVENIVPDLLPLLSHSAPFAIYHQYLQPLASCMHKLQVAKTAIGLQISEPWLREYQVLPSRTHPHMQMSAFGGYILSGTKIYGCNTGA